MVLPSSLHLLEIDWKENMSHDTHTLDRSNKDLSDGRSLAYYLDLAKDWTDPLGPLNIVNHEGFNVVRDDLVTIGTKGRFGDLLVSSCTHDCIVYVQPRCGYAGASLSYLCQQYGKRLVLFSPASKEPSLHQRWCWEHGAEMRFVKIAAMPVLGKIAREWAEKNGGLFVPLGLRHELVTAAGVKVAYENSHMWGHQPSRCWVATSTGVLSRALQIGWPDTQFINVAVARNIKDGENGRADIISHPQMFNQDAKIMPPYPSASNYDAKVWQHVLEHGRPGDYVWNVAGNIYPERTDMPNSKREWGDYSDAR